MEELLKQATTVARGMWKYRWPAVLVAWVVTIAGVVGVYRIPDRYEATARVYVDTQSILKPLMAGLAVQPNVQQQVTMLSRTLISRPNIEKLVRMADLDLGSRTKVEQDELVTNLMKEISVRGSPQDNLYYLAYENQDKDKAQRVIQSLVSIFVESSLGASRRDTVTARAFIDEQIKQYEARLQEAEKRVKDFRLRNIELQAADGLDSAARVASIASQLDQARILLREAENARDAAKAQLDAERGQGADIVAQSLLQESKINIATPELDARIDAAKRNLDGLLLRYTEQHPDVLSARRLIADLEAQKAKEMDTLRKEAMAMASTGPAGAGTTSPAYQELTRMVAGAEVQVATMRARVSELSARHAQAVGQLRTAPALEAELAQLNRDYAIHKKNYDDLVARRESLQMAGELESTAGVAEFRLIDPPRVSPQPVSPNRLALLPLALVAGLGAGIFLAFVASQLRPVFHDGSELRLKTKLPLIGIVSTVLSDARRRQQRLELVKFWSASGSLVALFLAGMVVVALMAQRGG